MTNLDFDSEEFPASKSKGHVLIVEDEPDAAIMLWQALAIEGYSPYVAHSVEESEYLLKRKMVDLIISDWHLPDGTGAKLCAAAYARYPHLPIIVISGVVRADDAELKACKPNLFLEKPFTMPKLYDSVEALLKG